MIIECTLQVRTYECDSYGHVNNAAYLNYLEYARYEFLKTIHFDYPAFVKAGYGIFIAHIDIEYKKPSHTDDILTIQTWPLKKGAVSGTLAQKIVRNGQIIVEAGVTWASVDTQGLPAKLPPQWDVIGLVPENLS